VIAEVVERARVIDVGAEVYGRLEAAAGEAGVPADILTDALLMRALVDEARLWALVAELMVMEG